MHVDELLRKVNEKAEAKLQKDVEQMRKKLRNAAFKSEITNLLIEGLKEKTEELLKEIALTTRLSGSTEEADILRDVSLMIGESIQKAEEDTGLFYSGTMSDTWRDPSKLWNEQQMYAKSVMESMKVSNALLTNKPYAIPSAEEMPIFGPRGKVDIGKNQK